ncbi:ELM1/GtrOC1 family putative glycosyltransferase [Methylopila henanensis]|uniref:ELM1/GtrOC1 family putative glycosyltransferase n=1 Tax=Methylopila henanensis TaxID=873516 RepID=A0ABW4K4W1_9HYPH
MVEAVAEAGDLDVVRKPLAFNPLGWLLNLRPGGSLFTLRPGARKSIAAPWPDVVVSAGKRSAAVALWIRARSGGRTRLVHLGRPSAPLGWFDLVVTTPQYDLPARPNVLLQRFPPTKAAGRRVAVRPDLAALPRPRLMAIAGGDADPQRLDADAARRFAEAALASARESGGAALLATSPRTPREAVAALKAVAAVADVSVGLSVYGEGADDYRAFLDAADAFLVTDDSASMITEAALSGAPVELFALPRRPGLKVRAFRALRRIAGRRAAEWTVALGLVRANRDIDRFIAALRADGLLDGGARAAGVAAAELADVASRVRALAGASRR